LHLLTPCRAAVDYEDSLIVAKPKGETSVKPNVISDQRLAPGILVGQRIPSVKVLSQADARPWHFQELLPSIGRWRVVVLPGDITQPAQAAKLAEVGKVFSQKTSFLNKFTPAGKPKDEVFEVLAVHYAPRHRVTIFDFPEVFRNFSETDGWDYNKIFADDQSYHEGHGKFYETFGVSPQGCIVILRPDQYVSYVGPIDEPDAVTDFFSGFMKPQSQ
jgi:phenol 2-monooxygenase